MASPEEKDKIENQETQKVPVETQEEREISPEEFLQDADIKKQEFEAQTEREIKNLNSVNLDEQKFNEIKKEDQIEKKLDETNQEAGVIIQNAKNEVEPNQNLEKKIIETLKVPEILVEEQRSAQLLSVMFLGYLKERDIGDNTLIEETKKYFLDNPLNEKIINFFKEIGVKPEETEMETEKGEIDIESMYNLAVAYNNPERIKKAMQMIIEHKKPLENLEEIRKKLFENIELFDKEFSLSPLSKKFNEEIEKDKKQRLDNMDETRERIKKIIDFFKPDSKTTNVKKLILMPTDQLSDKNSGRAFDFGNEIILKTNIENVDNLDHEFSHGIINPIVDKLDQKLTASQKEKITNLTNSKLKKEYGEDYYSLLCEELIRTYNDIFKKDRKLENLEDFNKKIEKITEQELQQFISQNQELKERCESLDIFTKNDFLNKSSEYFERFEKNQLRDLIFKLYEEYSTRKNLETNFEQFILDKLPSQII